MGLKERLRRPGFGGDVGGRCNGGRGANRRAAGLEAPQNGKEVRKQDGRTCP